MTDLYFDTADGLIDAFEIRENNKYTDITPLNDRKVGFSTQRKYPDDIDYEPLINGNGEVDTVALIHVIYTHPSENETEIDAYKVPLIIRAVTHSKYRSNHFDYNFEDKKSPTKESIERSKSTPSPIGLDFYNEFSYDHNSETFFDSAHEPLTGEELLETIFRAHSDTAHQKKGKLIRTKLSLQSNMVSNLGHIISFQKWILSKLFGRTIDDPENYFAYMKGYDNKSYKKLSTESLDVFGYKASRSVIILFCFIVTCSHFIRYWFQINTPYLDSIFSNNFLAVTHSLLILFLMDVVIPKTIFYSINLVIYIRTDLAFIKFKV